MYVSAMLVFNMLCRIIQSSDAHRTESVSVMDHGQTMGGDSMKLRLRVRRLRLDMVWNSLPAELQQCDSRMQFKRCLKTFLFGLWDYGAL